MAQFKHNKKTVCMFSAIYLFFFHVCSSDQETVLTAPTHNKALFQISDFSVKGKLECIVIIYTLLWRLLKKQSQ